MLDAGGGSAGHTQAGAKAVPVTSAVCPWRGRERGFDFSWATRKYPTEVEETPGRGSSLCAKGTASVRLVPPSRLLASCDRAGPLELSRRLFSDGPCAPTTPPHAYSHHRPTRPLHLHRCCCLRTRLVPPVFTDKHLCAPCLSLSSSKAAIPSPSLRGSPLSIPLVLPALLQPPRVW